MSSLDPDSRTLVLVPTRRELSAIYDPQIDNVRWESCGFGMAAAGARSGMLLGRWKPSHVVLAGIAGTYNGRLEVGSAYAFASVGCYGIGVGTRGNFQTGPECGLPYWEGPSPSIGDELWLDIAETPISQVGGGPLLTVATASSDAHDCEWRLAKFSRAVAEDMEAFAVAVACRFAEIPLTVLRGISNQAGDRNHQHWRFEESLASTKRLCAAVLTGLQKS